MIDVDAATPEHCAPGQQLELIVLREIERQDWLRVDALLNTIALYGEVQGPFALAAAPCVYLWHALSEPVGMLLARLLNERRVFATQSAPALYGLLGGKVEYLSTHDGYRRALETVRGRAAGLPAFPITAHIGGQFKPTWLPVGLRPSNANNWGALRTPFWIEDPATPLAVRSLSPAQWARYGADSLWSPARKATTKETLELVEATTAVAPGSVHGASPTCSTRRIPGGRVENTSPYRDE